jgi:hypothetical protein
MPPVQMGGHAATIHLVPALLPPHRKITNRRLAEVAALFFGCGTRRVSQRATCLPMKFVRKTGQDFSKEKGETFADSLKIRATGASACARP